MPAVLNASNEEAVLAYLSNKISFNEIPEILIDEEKQKMFAELKQGLEQQGLSFEDYLKNIKKTEEEIAQDFTKGAEERAKTALILRQIAKEEKVAVTPEELEQEMNRVKEMYKENNKIEERLTDPEIQNFIAVSLLNRKVLHLLKEVTLGDPVLPKKADEHKHVHGESCKHDHAH